MTNADIHSTDILGVGRRYHFRAARSYWETAGR